MLDMEEKHHQPPGPATSFHKPTTTRLKKRAVDYMVESESWKENEYMRRFFDKRHSAEVAAMEALVNDEHFKSWASMKGKRLRKELSEASSLCEQVP